MQSSQFQLVSALFVHVTDWGIFTESSTYGCWWCGLVAKSCLTLATPWPVVHQASPSMGILQARILEWVAIFFSRGSSQPRSWTQVSCIAGRFFTDWATKWVKSLSHVWPCDPMGCSLPGSSVHGIFQARILEWVAISFSRGSSWPRDWTRVSCIAGRRFTFWATREAQIPMASYLLCKWILKYVWIRKDVLVCLRSISCLLILCRQCHIAGTQGPLPWSVPPPIHGSLCSQLQFSDRRVTISGLAPTTSQNCEYHMW